MALIEVKVPDIGDANDVEVGEVLVNVGESVSVDQTVAIVEADKASMDIPCAHAGVVTEVRVRVGDKVSEGAVILTVEG
jgi:pyruvate/2-oxoglutarate dehydrogenase complex dihydrolipoamide acyltransferase (E2) component